MAGRNWRSTLEAANGDDDEDDDSRDVETPTATDLRRAREHTRAVVRDLEGDVQEFLEENTDQVSRLPDNSSAEQRVNEQITRLAQARLAEELVVWLEERRSQAMNTAAREAFDVMKSTVDRAVDDGELATGPYVQTADMRMNRLISQVDVGLYEKVSQDAADEMTRQLRLGVENGESIVDERPDETDLADRISWILTDADDPRRQTSGVSGQTVRSRSELIAHDSVQNGYNAAATRRYLQNGFRFVVYDATIDTKTTRLCTRLNEEVIDIRENPELIPPNHPWCRSGVRPKLRADQEPLGRDDIADDYLGTIARTNSYRPSVLDVQTEFSPTTLTRNVSESAGTGV